MHVPRWLSLLVALWVIVFGLYRLWLARNPRTDEARAEGKKGMFAMSRRTHLLIGLVYLLLGGALIATSFGWNPLAALTQQQPAGKGRAVSPTDAIKGRGAARPPPRPVIPISP
jgi:hypothetical protein